MARNKKVNWGGWTRYYIGRALELAGLLLVSLSILQYFGRSEMRPMLAMAGIGVALFFVGWLAARVNPEANQ